MCCLIYSLIYDIYFMDSIIILQIQLILKRAFKHQIATNNMSNTNIKSN